jgi:hypothetical protein
VAAEVDVRPPGERFAGDEIVPKMTLPATYTLPAKRAGQRGAVDGRNLVYQRVPLIERGIHVSVAVGKKVLGKASLEKEPISQHDFEISRG